MTNAVDSTISYFLLMQMSMPKILNFTGFRAPYLRDAAVPSIEENQA